MHKIVHGIDYIWFTSIIFCPTRVGMGAGVFHGGQEEEEVTLKRPL